MFCPITAEPMTNSRVSSTELTKSESWNARVKLSKPTKCVPDAPVSCMSVNA